MNNVFRQFIPVFPQRQCGGCKIFLCHPPSSSSLLLCFVRCGLVQLTVPIGDDGQLMFGASGGRPVLWLSTHAVQLTVPIGDDGQLMS